MMENKIYEKLREDVRIPDVVLEKAEDAFAQIRGEAVGSESANVPAVRTARRRMPRRKLAILLAAAVLTLGTVSVGAAALMKWSKSLEEGMQVTEETKQTVERSSMTDFPEQSVTQNGVTVTAQQSIADNFYAALSFKVEGYEVPEGGEPGFDRVNVEVEGMDVDMGAGFYNGLVMGPDFRAMRADGREIQSDENGAWIMDYTMEDGSMEYRIDVTSSDMKTPILGKQIHVTLENLGVYGSKAGPVETGVEGTWEFEWTLQGSDTITNSELNAPLGDTGATVKSVELSPISIKLLYDFPRQAIEETGYDQDGNAVPHTDYACPPAFWGFRMKDGSLVITLSGQGAQGYADEESDEYLVQGALERVVDVNQVESLLFMKTEPAEGEPVTEENCYIVPIA